MNLIEKSKLKEMWKEANNAIGSLGSWGMDDIRKGRHPEYKNEAEYMKGLGYNEGIQAVCHIMSDSGLI